MPWFYEESEEISVQKKEELMEHLLEEAKKKITKDFKRVLLLPPDFTRYHSGSGELTEMLYKLLPKKCNIDVIPTLGQHQANTNEENRRMFGSIPLERFYKHDWRKGCKILGEISADYVKKVSHGKADWPLPIEINRMVLEGKYDLIINIGQVVPHEVLGFSNHNKNYFIGLGSKRTICASFRISASLGIENNLGQLLTPLRVCYNEAERKYLGNLPDVYALIVMDRNSEGKPVTTGLYIGDDVETYFMAARRSQKQNITILDKPVKKIVAIMQAEEFESTWVANKAIYRTRMAIANEGELLIIAPGLERFGEQPEVDDLIRKYGYVGTETIMEQYKRNSDLQDLTHAAVHLIYGSSENRFTITYAPGKLTREEIESVNFKYMDLNKAMQRYNPDRMSEGWNVTPDGEKIYFINSPSTGLWACKKKFRKK